MAQNGVSGKGSQLEEKTKWVRSGQAPGLTLRAALGARLTS